MDVNNDKNKIYSFNKLIKMKIRYFNSTSIKINFYCHFIVFLLKMRRLDTNA